MPNDWLRESIRSSAKDYAESAKRKKFQDEFATINRAGLAKMPDSELAAWQSNFPELSPQAILANYEWQRRLTIMQIKAAQFAAWLGIAGVVIGVALGWLLSTFVSK